MAKILRNIDQIIDTQGNDLTAPVLSFRNKIINGDMRIDQRNDGSAVTPSSTTYTLDRYRLFMDVGSKLTVQRVEDAPAGFTYSTKISVENSYTPNTNEQFFFGTAFEADNVGSLGFGTAAPQTTTLSFWIKSSIQGTYSFSWTNDANDLSYVNTFEILSQNTWEKKTITIVGDNTGTWINTGNGRHSFMQISLGAGSAFYGLPNIWQSGNLRQTSDSIDFVNQVNGSTLYITGVQLEIGTTSTPFEHRPYGLELDLCRRFYQKYWYAQATSMTPGLAGTYWGVDLQFNTTFRASPTLSIVTPSASMANHIEIWGGYVLKVQSTSHNQNSFYFCICDSATYSYKAMFHLECDAEL